MIRLVVSDLLRDPRPWIGLVAVTAAVSAVAVFTGGLFAQIATTDDDTMRVFFVSLGSVVALGTTIAVFIVIGGTVTLSVALRRRTVALWQAVGILPRRVWTITVGQVALAAVVGAVIGAGLGALGYPAMYRYGLSSLEGHLHSPEPQLPVWVAPSAVAVVVLLTTLAGMRGARSAARTEITGLLREPEPRRVRGRWIRVPIALAVVGAAVASLIAANEDGAEPASVAPLFAPMLVIAVTIAGPLLYGPVIRLWTALLPARVAPSWYLARNAARFRVGFSAAAVGPLIVAIVLVSGLYTAGATLSTLENGRDFSIEPSQIALMFGGPLLVSVVGASAAVYVTGSDRARERALLTAAGAQPHTLLVTAVLEAVILAVTAVLLALVTVLASAVLVQTAAATPRIVIDVLPVVLIGGAGFILMLAATTAPVLLSRRTSPMRSLTAE